MVIFYIVNSRSFVCVYKLYITNDKRVKPFLSNLFLFAGFRFLCYFQRLMIKGRPVDKVKLMSLFSFGSSVLWKCVEYSICVCPWHVRGCRRKMMEKQKFDDAPIGPNFCPYNKTSQSLRLCIASAFIPYIKWHGNAHYDRGNWGWLMPFYRIILYCKHKMIDTEVVCKCTVHCACKYLFVAILWRWIITNENINGSENLTIRLSPNRMQYHRESVSLN